MKLNSIKLPERLYDSLDLPCAPRMNLVDQEIVIRVETKNKEVLKMLSISKRIDTSIEIIFEIKKISQEIHVGLILSGESKNQPHMSCKLTSLLQIEARFRKGIGAPYNKNMDVVFLHSSNRPPGPGEKLELPSDVALKIVACENGNTVVYLSKALPSGKIMRLAKRVRRFLKGIHFSDEGVNKEEPP